MGDGRFRLRDCSIWDLQGAGSVCRPVKNKACRAEGFLGS